jgi:hypothetical protein
VKHIIREEGLLEAFVPDNSPGDARATDLGCKPSWRLPVFAEQSSPPRDGLTPLFELGQELRR